MKPTLQCQRQLGILVAFLLLSSFATKSIAEEPVSLSAKVLGVRGSATFSTNNQTWQLLKKGDSLPIGTTVQTTEGSQWIFA
jgi:hypothetical protein